jgi:hypothetical protein
MEPVQAPVKVHVVVPSVEQLMLVVPNPVLQGTVVPLGLASACWMALLHTPTALVACAAAGVPPNPSSNVMVRPKTATAVREQNRNRRTDPKSMLGPRQESTDKLMEITNTHYCKKATFATIPPPG